jgi:hypothetical protein
MLCIMLISQLLIRPFAAMEANIVEICSILVLLILSSFNIASSSRVSGWLCPFPPAHSLSLVNMVCCHRRRRPAE